MINDTKHSNSDRDIATWNGFNKFSDDQLDQLRPFLRIRNYQRGQILFNQGDLRENYFYLIEGIVRNQQVTEDGKENILSYVCLDEAFPYVGLFNDKEYVYSAQAMTDIKIAVLPMKMFEETLIQNPQSMAQVIAKMGQIIGKTEVGLQKFATTNAKRRILNGILYLGDQVGQRSDHHTVEIPLPITLIELSKISGTTRETTSQMVQTLVNEGKIKYQHKYFSIIE